MTKMTRRGGFTLIELMITVVIVAILSVVAMAGYARYKANARRTEGISAINDIRMKQETFYSTYSRYVTSDTDEDVWEGVPQTGQLAGFYEWTVACPAPGNAWCILGFRPPIANVSGTANMTYFQYQTIGWAPGAAAPTMINNAADRWLVIRARGLPDTSNDHCTMLQFSNENTDVLVFGEQGCGT